MELLDDPLGAKYYKKIMQRLNMAEAKGKLGTVQKQKQRADKKSIKDSITTFVGFKEDGFWPVTQSIAVLIVRLIIFMYFNML